MVFGLAMHGKPVALSRGATNGCLSLFKYLQGLDEEAEPNVRFKQISVGEEEEEEGRGRSRGRGLGLRVGGSAVTHAGSTAVSSGLVA